MPSSKSRSRANRKTIAPSVREPAIIGRTAIAPPTGSPGTGRGGLAGYRASHESRFGRNTPLRDSMASRRCDSRSSATMLPGSESG